MTEEKIWETKEWRKASQGKLGDKCKQCSSTENLSIHHEISFSQLIFLNTRKLIIPKICSEIGAMFNPSVLVKRGGLKTSKGYIKINILASYLKDHPELKTEANNLAKKEYLTLSNTITICKRCHFAKHKGLVLCEYCKKNYYNPKRFLSCANCRKKVDGEIMKGIEEIEIQEDAFEKKYMEYFNQLGKN